MMYTKSVDGKQRTTLHATIRLTREEYAVIHRAAKEEEQTVRQYLNQCLSDGLWSDIMGRSEDKNQEK